MSIGFRVYTERPLPAPSLVEAFRALAAAPVADCMGRLGAFSSLIRRFSPYTGRNMAGVALTVKARPGDNLMIHKALDMARPGDVIVVANEGCQNRALMGEVMFSYGVFKKIEGLVLDGPIRDVECLERLPLTVYATGTTPGGPYKEGPGEINVPVTCGQTVVHPGDIVLGDADGVIVIPFADAQALLHIATDFAARDAAKSESALKGTGKRDWVDASLTEKGCATIAGMWNDRV